MNNPEPGTWNSGPKTGSLLKIIAVWFFLQVLLNAVSAAYLTLNPPDAPVSWFDRLDLTVNTGVNAALAVGFWRRTRWAWSAAVWLVPLYWTLYIRHMLVPEEGLILWPFLMVDAVILGWLLGPNVRGALEVSRDRWAYLSFFPAPMFALAFYAMLAPVLGMFVAIAGASAVVFVGWKKAVFRSHPQ